MGRIEPVEEPYEAEIDAQLRSMMPPGAEPIALFAERASLTPEQVVSLTRGTADDGCWPARDQLLVRLVDALHDDADVSDELWESLANEFDEAQLLSPCSAVGITRSASQLAPPKCRSRRAPRPSTRSTDGWT